MKSELNNYKITNLDGVVKSNNEGKVRFDNDNPHYVNENSLSGQNEVFTEQENYTFNSKNTTEKQNISTDVSNTATTTSTPTSIASSTSAVSSLGSVIGGVVSSVATAVMVVVAFVSIMTINISLVLAGTSSLIFKLDIANAQEEDFANPVVAVLEGYNGYYYEQEIFADSVYLTFEDLEAGQEYTLTIKNEEKIFAQKTYFTATEQVERGFVEAWSEENTVYASVYFRELNPRDFYTLTATNSQGKVIFQSSDTRPEQGYSFDIESPDTLSFTLSINGKVCCFQQLQVEFKTEDIEHNYIPRGFVWDYDENNGWTAVGEGVCKDCDDVLRIPAQMSRDGDLIVATITYNGTTYSDKRVEIDLTGKENVISEDNCYYLKSRSFVLGNLESEDSVSYEHDENHPYIIKGTADSLSNSVIVYNRIITKTDYYFEFDNLNIVADAKENANILTVQTVSDVTIHIAIRGSVRLITDGAYCFNVENTGINEISVKFDITFVDEYSSFYCCDESINTMNLYDDESDANIVFNINGYQVSPNGRQISQEDESEADEGVELSLIDGAIYIRPNDYVQYDQNESYTVNDCSETNPYIISGSTRASESIDIYNFTDTLMGRTGRGNGQKETFYITLDNISIWATDWCTAFRIIASEDVDIYITVVGNVEIEAHNHAAFSLQGEADCHANIYVTCEGGFENFICYDSYLEETRVYECDSGMSINFYMNGVQVDASGNQL